MTVSRRCAMSVSAVTVAGALALGLAASASAVTLGSTRLVSMGFEGDAANNASRNAAVSADGRYVAFMSSASNLVPDDTNSRDDIFVYDTLDGTTTRVSVDSDGFQANAASSSTPSLSGDGRFIVFQSAATNLVPDDTNNVDDVFLHDTTSRTTTRISVASDGTQANRAAGRPKISADGRYVSYHSSATNLAPGLTGAMNVFRYSIDDQTTTLVSVDPQGAPGGGESAVASLSADGNLIAFHSDAANLVPGDTNARTDIFVRDMTAGTTTRISVATDGTEGDDRSQFPAISGDGRFVTYFSGATTLVPDDTNGVEDIFVYDSSDGTTTRISIATDGTQSDGTSYTPAISGDGRFISYRSQATTLAPVTSSGFHVFVRDTVAGTTTLVSATPDGSSANTGSMDSVISADGRFIAFESQASDLVAGNSNFFADIFIRELSIPSAPTPSPTVDPAPPALAATGHESNGLALIALTALAGGTAILAGLAARRARAS